jgi:hypothetical protein
MIQVISIRLPTTPMPYLARKRGLCLPLDRCEAHVRSLYRLADCFCVDRISLVTLYVRSAKLRGD